MSGKYPFKRLPNSAFLSSVKAFLRDERGSVAMEYGVIAIMIAIAIIATLVSIGDSLRDVWFAAIADAMSSAASNGGS